MFEDRTGTDALKFDGVSLRYGDSQHSVLPMWVADMDIPPPDNVGQSINAFLAGHYGYQMQDIAPAIVDWHGRRHQPVQDHEVVSCQSVIGGIKSVIEALTQPNDTIALFAPVYAPLIEVVRACHRTPVLIPFDVETGPGRGDLDGIPKNIAMLVLCNPQNPTGHVWPQNTLVALASLCQRLRIPMVCDEVHSAFVSPTVSFCSALQLAGDLRQTTIVLQSATKAYNLAHIPGASYAVIPKASWQQQVRRCIEQCHLYSGTLSNVSLMAAYSEQNDGWLKDVSLQIHSNRKQLEQGLAYSSLAPVNSEATFFCWLDLTALYPSQEQVARLLFADTGIAANDGASFGSPGWVRLNVATNPNNVTEALKRLQLLWQQI
ncbi:aminotransferase class I/II-fold pyridoxal phosphate-dependent enzyme [Alteromonas sp. 14N.309.X.WAT.G.H12]|uniref:aminotransferase class I/II-fold pyridoxal phosphate-dependent enzyme n=1 Tax=Alteromonas sp. 14N.309.X.WAT.G.H12 TaxID=3120824 RepID=UPI002FD3D6C6